MTVANTTPTKPRDARLASSGSGLGLVGLRRRIEVLGGTMVAGPGADGGFLLDVSLPSFVATGAKTGRELRRRNVETWQ